MKLTDYNIESYKAVVPPLKLKFLLPLSKNEKKFVLESRKAVQDILTGKDNRKLIIAGPCSIHDTKAGLEYAEKLSLLSKKVRDVFFIIMRTYFEKPRTSIGWKGLINDPCLDGSYDINAGLKKARKLLINITRKKVACATEFLEPITPQFFDDLITYAAIGARTCESPTHRQLASGVSMPIGIKNTRQGDIVAAINAVKSANQEQAFLGMDELGRVCSIKTKGNRFCHVILRGGKEPNYSSHFVKKTADSLKEKGLCSKIVIDCSHGNSGKDHRKQGHVFNNIIKQIKNKNKDIAGVMLESNLVEGSQKIPPVLKGFNKKSLKYGVSVTDSCIGWEETEKIILDAYYYLKK